MYLSEHLVIVPIMWLYIDRSFITVVCWFSTDSVASLNGLIECGFEYQPYLSLLFVSFKFTLMHLKYPIQSAWL